MRWDFMGNAMMTATSSIWTTTIITFVNAANRTDARSKPITRIPLIVGASQNWLTKTMKPDKKCGRTERCIEEIL